MVLPNYTVLVKVKIHLQRLWEEKVDWDDPVPDVWLQWRNELKLLSNHPVVTTPLRWSCAPCNYMDSPTRLSWHTVVLFIFKLKTSAGELTLL